MSAFFAIYLREIHILKRRLKKQLAAAAVSPLLYMLTFGYALGSQLRVDGGSYLEFLIPGLIGMASMTQAFGIASEINIARFYSCVFEEIQASPAGRFAYVLGEMCAGLTRVVLSCLVVIVLAASFGVWLHWGFFMWLGVFLNGFVFASLAIALAMLVRSHADQSLLSNFVITPMAFLGGTFFPMDKLPEWAQAVLSVLPLTHATGIIRADCLGTPISPLSYAVLAAFAVVFFLFALHAVGRAKD